MIAVVIFDQATQHDTTADRKLLGHRGQSGIANQIEVHRYAIGRGLFQCLLKILIDTIDAVIVTKRLKRDAALIVAAGDGDRRGTGTLRQLSRHGTDSSHRSGYDNHISLPNLCEIDHASPSGQARHTQYRQRQRGSTQCLWHARKRLRELITEHLPTTVTTDQRSNRPLRIVTFTNAGNRLPGDHVAGIDTVSHMVAGDY